MNARAVRDIVLFLLIALGTCIIYVLRDQTHLFWDEYYHLLAARSWASDGTLAVGDGAYGRSAWISVSVGWLFRVFGESIALARMGSALLTALWALVVFLWTRREVGRLAGWTAGLLFALSPLVLVNSVLVRFYGVAGLLVTLAAIACHMLVDRVRDWRPGAALVLGATLCVVVAYQVTELTRIWVLGLLVWVGGAFMVQGMRSRHRVWVASVGAAAAAVALIVAWQSGWVEAVWPHYRYTPAWGVERAGDIRWYERMIRHDYPVLSGLFPAAVVMALLRQPKLAGICLTVFSVGMVVLSGAGTKAERYAIPLLPYFFVLWGIAVAEFAPALRSWISASSHRLLAWAPPELTRATHPLLLATVIAPVLLANPGFVRIRHIPTGHVRFFNPEGYGIGTSPQEWDELAPTLRAVMNEVDVVVTSNALPILYHVGDYDYTMRPTVVAELWPPEEFTVDPRTGRPAISTIESLRTVMREHSSGLIIGEVRRWGHPWEGFTRNVAEYVYANLDEVVLPERFKVRAYRWGPSSTQ